MSEEKKRPEVGELSNGDPAHEDFSVKRLHKEFTAREDVFEMKSDRQVSGVGARAFYGRFGDNWTVRKLGAWVRVFGRNGNPFPKIEMPRGQARLWLADVIGAGVGGRTDHFITDSGVDVAKTLAFLCGDDSQVRISIKNLAEAVGKVDSLGRKKAYTESGIDVLVRHGWIRKEKGAESGRNSTTTFYLTTPES